MEQKMEQVITWAAEYVDGGNTDINKFFRAKINNEIMPELVWDLAPFTFLYDLFVAWFKRGNPGGYMPNYVKFVNNLYAVLCR